MAKFLLYIGILLTLDLLKCVQNNLMKIMPYLDETSFITIRNQTNRLLDNHIKCLVEHFSQVVLSFVMMQKTETKFPTT